MSARVYRSCTRGTLRTIFFAQLSLRSTYAQRRSKHTPAEVSLPGSGGRKGSHRDTKDPRPLFPVGTKCT